MKSACCPASRSGHTRRRSEDRRRRDGGCARGRVCNSRCLRHALRSRGPQADRAPTRRRPRREAPAVCCRSSGSIRFRSPYYKRKLACEQRIAASGTPYTILRATQFHELIASVARAAERLPLALLPLDFRFQTVAAADVSERVAELIGGQPSGGILNFGGPEVLSLEQMAEAWKAARGRPRRVVRLPLPGKVARGFREGRNTCPEQAAGRQSWSEFVASGAPSP